VAEQLLEGGLVDVVDVKAAKKKTVVQYLNDISYDVPADYVPSAFALEFINFIKLVNGSSGEEHPSPVVHMRMLDLIVDADRDGRGICNLCSRGLAKTTLLGEYLFLYIAVYGAIPEFGDVNLAMYVSDSIENGVKNMRKNLEFRWEDSEFLQKYVPYTRFTDVRWEFKNLEGHRFIIKGYGAKTGVRGNKELGVRPQVAVLDDLVSDEDARSPTVIAAIESTVDRAVNFALHPSHSLIIWSGTPFNAKDPLYKAVESGAWMVNAFPVCEMFPCTREQFRGAWEERFPYEYVVKQYNKALLQGKIQDFNQELMLRIMSDEDRLVKDHQIQWYPLEQVTKNKYAYNFYITTDYATSEKDAADFSVISVWAHSHAGDWLWVDGVCKRQEMDKNIDDTFRLAQKWNPISVGVEISGQQKGFIKWLLAEMGHRNQSFALASDKTSGELGIRPVVNKLERFMVVQPQFAQHKFWFPEELRLSDPMVEMHDELTLLSRGGFKSKKDDFGDTISMLGSINAYRPSQPIPGPGAGQDIWGEWEESTETSAMDSYIV
jgi:phage terminase large subunit-like protein